MHDSALERNGFEISVPRQIESWFEASVGMGSIDRRRGGIIQVVVGLGKPIELFRRPRSPVAAEKSSVIIAGPSIRAPVPSRARS